MIQIAIVEDEEIYVKQLTEMEKISLKITVAVLTLF